MNTIDRPLEMTPAQTAELVRIEAMVVPRRACGTCSLCCKVLNISELAKPAGQWCTHCRPGKGCGIHATRPFVCRGFYCEWMISKGLGPEWRPEQAKFALFKTNSGTNGGRRLTAHVDPGYPAAWRRSPYYENFKAWAVQAVQKTPEMDLVDVMIGERVIVILPDREVDVGIVAADEFVRLQRKVTTAGEIIEVDKIKRTQ
jgi:hypothetical protein